jgi:hypothetical protein
MGTTRKVCGVNVEAAKKMYEDIGAGNVRTYTTASFSITQLTDVHPDRLLGKCVEVRVAVSGDPGSGCVWMGVMPFRVDHVAGGTGELEMQGDMTLLVFSGNHTTPAASGIVAYHQGFDGQNVPLCEYRNLTPEEATEVLRLDTVERKQEIQQAGPQFLSTFKCMVDKYRPDLLAYGRGTAD